MVVMTIVMMMMMMMRNDGSGDSGDQVIPMVTLLIDGHDGGNAGVSDCGGYGKGDFDYGYGYGDLKRNRFYVEQNALSHRMKKKMYPPLKKFNNFDFVCFPWNT